MTELEEWRPVVGYEGAYEVSSQGRVRRLPTTPMRGRSSNLRYLKITTHHSGYQPVYLSLLGTSKTKYVHRLVCEAFHGPSPEGRSWALHRDGSRDLNTPENLYWGDVRDNVRDMMGHGTHYKASQTKCDSGHPFDVVNTAYTKEGRRRCKTCLRKRARARTRRELPSGDPRHGSLNGYNNWGCRCNECQVARRDYANSRKS